jgi:mannose-1-phosphate guanylyltransferase/mannose-6-phosphate isomerase
MHPVVICGGAGTRLWPLSRKSFPKQFIELINGSSLFNLTVNRVKSIGSPIFVTNEHYRYVIRQSLSDIFGGNFPNKIIFEPESKNTGPALAMASLYPDLIDDDLVLVVPSDQFLPDNELFLKTVSRAIPVADEGNIVLLGVPPTSPNDAYGYIKKGPHYPGDKSLDLIYQVERFVEKPNINVAVDLVSSGDYLWNTGIFLSKVSTLRQGISELMPEVWMHIVDAMNGAKVNGCEITPCQDSLMPIEPVSIDVGLMERSTKVAVIKFDGVWSDMGSWTAISELYPSDESGNRFDGSVFPVQANNNFVYTRGKPVALVGVDDLVVVDGVDSILVSNKDSLEAVKLVVSLMAKNKIHQAENHRMEYRPWGWFDVLEEGENFKVKRIKLEPKSSISLQLHKSRSEHWVIVKGVATVTCGNVVTTLSEGESIFIPINTKHRIENLTQDCLEIIEIQVGNYLGEDDIIRFQDSYGRN